VRRTIGVWDGGFTTVRKHEETTYSRNPFCPVRRLLCVAGYVQPLLVKKRVLAVSCRSIGHAYRMGNRTCRCSELPERVIHAHIAVAFCGCIKQMMI
jgi:hypothetical protein